MLNYTFQINGTTCCPQWTVGSSHASDDYALKYAASLVRDLMPGVDWFMSLTVWANEGCEDFPESRFVGTIKLNTPTTHCDRETP
jgi:hypothetical protein